MNTVLEIAIQAAIEGGKKIMEVYAQDFSVFTKEDSSPLTEADRQAHESIKAILAETNLPLLSEEGKLTPFEERKNWETFWLVDPLDGTKEFIKRNGEFTVNIALIKNGTPVLGVVFVPVTGMLYFGTEEKGSYYLELGSTDVTLSPEDIIAQAKALPSTQDAAVYTVVASRSHNTPETEAFIDEKRKKHGEVNTISAGSSLKLCLVAEGMAQVYPRLAPTMEWDTAAGHAVAKYAGCQVYDFKSNTELQYNKENLLNPWFVVERA
jgi:3'(2'), 5'-bisphosphate nucleotidase